MSIQPLMGYIHFFSFSNFFYLKLVFSSPIHIYRKAISISYAHFKSAQCVKQEQ